MTDTTKPKVRTTTAAVVTLTIEISNVGSWGPDCQIEQVYRQAREAARRRVSKAFDGDRHISIVGVPNIRCITTDMDVKS